MRISISELGYLPTIDFFHKMYHSDIFILLDNIVTDSRHVKTAFKTPNGKIVLTVPIFLVKNQLIKDTKIVSNNWQRQHWNCIELAYKGCKYHELVEGFRDFYLNNKWENLGKLNIKLVKKIHGLLDIKTKLVRFSSLKQDILKTYPDGYMFTKSFKERTYKQLHGKFISDLSFLDFLFNCGGIGKYDLEKYFIKKEATKKDGSTN